jgi:two-component system cell cycle sensor histidine kinase/response regulator CckA
MAAGRASADTDLMATTSAGPRRGWSLRGYFALLVAVFVTAGASGAAYVHVQAGRDARTQSIRDARYAADVASKQLGRDVASFQAGVQSLAATPNIGSVLRQPVGCSLSYQREAPSDLGHIDIVRADGTPVCSSRPVDARPIYGNTGWLRRALAGRVLLAPVPDSATDHQVAVASVPIPGGVAAAFLDLSALGGSLASTYGGGREVVFLVTSRDGRTVIARSLDPKRWVGAGVAGTPFAPAGKVERPDLEGTQRLFQQATVPGVGWRLYVGEDVSAILLDRSRLEKRQLAIIVAGLAAFLLTALLVYRRVAKPIAELGAAVRSTGQDGRPAPVSVPVAAPVEVRALAQDVNGLISSVNSELLQRQQAVEALRRSEESYRILFERHPAPMWVFDPDARRIVAVNEAAIATYGYTREQFFAKPIEELVPQGDRLALLAATSDPDRGRLVGADWQIVKSDGARADTSVSADAIEFEGRPARLVLAEDVTEQRRLEDQLRQAQKMEAIGNLAGGIAHDFNNILMVIRTCSTLLLGRVDDPAIADEVRHIDDAAERGAGLTHQLLAFSRQQVLRPEVTNPNTVVEEMLGLFRRVIGEDVTIVQELEPAPQSIVVDRGQLGQVVMNLVVNAREAMPTGGTLTVHTANVTLDDAYASAHVGVAPGQYVLLQITDSGQGMDEPTRRRVFDPFFTTKDTGTGLGLATVYGVVKQSGGQIWLYSEPGLGTTFKLYFPSTSLPAAPAATPAGVSSLDGTETILLVEDEEVLRRLIKKVLETYGYTVLEAGSGAEAVAIAADGDTPIQLVLTDVVMPGMNGRELAERLLLERPALKVLFSSGYPADTISRHGVPEAAADFIEKPYGLDELARKIRELLARPSA